MSEPCLNIVWVFKSSSPGFDWGTVFDRGCVSQLALLSSEQFADAKMLS